MNDLVLPFGDRLSRACAALGVLGVVIVIAADIIGVVVHPTTGFIADTISDLAAGRHAWIQDIGLYAFAIGTFSVAVALVRAPLGWIWRVACVLLMTVAVLIAVIGGYGEYGDNDTGGLVIHIYLVVALGAGFAVVALLLAPGLSRIGAAWSRLDIVLAVLWIAAGTVFFFVPTGWDGLFERGVAMLLCIWIVMASRLVARPRRAAAPAPRTL